MKMIKKTLAENNAMKRGDNAFKRGEREGQEKK